jgi:hypothetical protein
MPDLIRMLHGKKDSIEKIVGVFQSEFPNMSKVQIKKRIIEISEKSKSIDGTGTARHIVKQEFITKYGVTEVFFFII